MSTCQPSPDLLKDGGGYCRWAARYLAREPVVQAVEPGDVAERGEPGPGFLQFQGERADGAGERGDVGAVGGKIGHQDTFRARACRNRPGRGPFEPSACRHRHHGHDEEERRQKSARARRWQENLPGRGQVHAE